MPNGFQCPACYSVDSFQCHNETVNCTGSENQCVDLAGLMNTGNSHLFGAVCHLFFFFFTWQTQSKREQYRQIKMGDKCEGKSKEEIQSLKGAYLNMVKGQGCAFLPPFQLWTHNCWDAL